MTRISPSLIVAALLSVLSMSLVPLIIRTTDANEYVIGIVRLGIALLFLSPLIFGKYQLARITRQQWWLLVAVGVIFGVHWLMYFISIKTSSASIAALAVSTYGIHLLIINWLFNRHPIRPAEWAAIALCFAGCFLVAPSFNLNDQGTRGLLIGMLSGLLYAMLPLLHQKLRSVPTMVRAWAQFAFALIVFVPMLPLAQWSHLGFDDLWRLAVLGIVCTLIGHSLWVKVSTELPAVLTAVTYYLYVPIAMLASFWLLDEAMDAQKIIGAALIIGGNIGTALLAWQRQRDY